MPHANLEQRRAATREAVRRHRGSAGRKPGRKPVGKPAPMLAELRETAGREILDAMLQQMRSVLADRSLDSVTRARCVSYVGCCGLRAIEGVDLASRLDCIETVLRERGDLK